MNIFEEQNKILFNAIRTVATNKRCPDWIKDILSKAAMEVKTLKASAELVEEEYVPFQIGDTVKNRDEPRDTCLYQIIEFGDVIDNIQLFTVKIIKGNASVPPGTIFHNVAEFKLVKVK